MTNNQCICRSFAEVCHENHNVVEITGNFGYYDCGANNLANQCKIHNDFQNED
jgi:hypothetical protein